MEENTTEETVEPTEATLDDTAPTEHTATDDETPQAEAETFPRKVVEDLRRENANYRTRAQRADDLAARLHTSLVAATGRLADPSDLTFDESHLDDQAALPPR